jgi:hypothetical protein
MLQQQNASKEKVSSSLAAKPSQVKKKKSHLGIHCFGLSFIEGNLMQLFCQYYEIAAL